tara:strand:- start:1234 stop:1476 length:243 start_codon:yes stop_codon:yes gene_type:complete
MGATTLGDTVEKIKVEDSVKEQPKPTEKVDVGLGLNLDETKFVLAKLAQMEYKGVEIEFIYHLLQKLQNHLQYLLTKESK